MIEINKQSQQESCWQPSPLAADIASKVNDKPADWILLSAIDLAREFRVSVKTIRRLDQAGKLPMPVSLGGRLLRWRREEIVAWVAAGAPDREEWTRFRQAAMRTARREAVR